MSFLDIYYDFELSLYVEALLAFVLAASFPSHTCG
ncbi:uncharacterized protein FRV6_09468 [Fusarium oxysporum]|uniref:Uncharacterized protein n=1 Tax=Fusarium oxysporum TaxID=5507 RepID=A0A2H3THX8_FUSOX|nr:uncharacterized protein FRV6_09468 [Fusarium oxysporum]